MRDFTCPNCGQRLAFENSLCLSCGSSLGFSLQDMALLVIAPDDDVTFPHFQLMCEGRHRRGVWLGGLYRWRAVELMATQGDAVVGDAGIEECSCTVPGQLRHGREFDRPDQQAGQGQRFDDVRS
jgi:hypothetical protein